MEGGTEHKNPPFPSPRICGGCHCSSLAGENVSEHRARGLVGYRTDRSLTGKVQSVQDPGASEQKGTIRTDSTAGLKMICKCTEP